jgi:hypothetical protein
MRDVLECEPGLALDTYMLAEDALSLKLHMTKSDTQPALHFHLVQLTPLVKF